ncbi:hypothetical protein CEXT_500631 [Caerostris extrusa]|uniref:Uncharacterized protein n=1 Tax=Caerostris extrusa TaxID=172846 RepID=A0AAV4XBW3_CAEEX|nr:hypothetical protein CEXT_500631 [Caerostris extrusa]
MSSSSSTSSSAIFPRRSPRLAENGKEGVTFRSKEEAPRHRPTTYDHSACGQPAPPVSGPPVPDYTALKEIRANSHREVRLSMTDDRK